MKPMIVSLLLLLSSTVQADAFSEGVEAYRRNDFNTANSRFRQAASQGHAKAQLGLGLMYAEGKGVEQDEPEAFRWFRLAAAQGQSEAQQVLGYYYASGRGVTKNDAEAVRWYRRAAAQGQAEAQRQLAVHYFTGAGVSKDIGRSLVCWSISASNGNVVAQKNFEEVSRLLRTKMMMTPEHALAAHRTANPRVDYSKCE